LKSEELVRLPDQSPDTPANTAETIGARTVGIVFYPDYQAAVVDSGASGGYTIVDLTRLSEWRLRLVAAASSAAEFEDSFGSLRVKRVTARTEPAAKVVIGYVKMVLSSNAVAGASVMNDQGKIVATTLPNGAFKLPTDTWPARLKVEHPDFLPSGQTLVSGDPRQRGQVSIVLARVKPRFGDIIAVIPVYPDSIGFLGTKLHLLWPQGGGTNWESHLQPLDTESGKTLPPLCRFQSQGHVLSAFAGCGDRLLATMTYPGRIYELDIRSGTGSLLLEPRTKDGRRIDWPRACAFDGERFWFVEEDPVAPHYALHALNPHSLQIEHSLDDTATKLHAIAWDPDRRQFWGSNRNGQVYAVNRDQAIASGKVTPIPNSMFKGRFSSLACGRGFLWGVDDDLRRICQIQITD
ncbi:MAG: hypothetical protein NT154_38825, partial [Verrucomicrobia bacterium]|nr:hypothetical protein [Verrucomicrobiota bacterium]